jgi:hypothetical protein
VAQWRLVTDSVNIVSQKKANCSFFDYNVITCENTSFIMLSGKFLLLSTSRVPFLIILKLNIVLDFAFRI